MAPTENLTPPGSSTYTSETLSVGDGTWDATRNDFLLPNLVGFNYETTVYNGMGNRFAGEEAYHDLVRAHGVIAAITFLLVIPAAIMIIRFYTRMPGYGLKYHVYLQIITVGLVTALIIIGFLQVGPARNLSNPHHVIGLTLYLGILLQALLGRYLHHREKKKPFTKMPLKLYLHQWFGRVLALLGIVQVALGLALYGAPKWLFILYALWVACLLITYFVLSYRRTIKHQDIMLSRDVRNIATASPYRGTKYDDDAIPDDDGEKSRILKWAPVAAGAALIGAATKRASNRNKYGGQSRRSSFATEKTDATQKGSGPGRLSGLIAAAGAASLFKGFWDSRARKAEESGYDSVDPDTPSRRRQRPRLESWSESYTYDESQGGRTAMNPPTEGPILPGPGNPLMAAETLDAAEGPGHATRPAGTVISHDSDSYTYDSSSLSPVRRSRPIPESYFDRIVRGLGVGWFFDKLQQRRQQRRNGGVIPEDQATEYTSYTGPAETESSILSTVRDNQGYAESAIPSSLQAGRYKHSSRLSREPPAATAAANSLAAAEEGRSLVESSVFSSANGSRQPVASVKVQVHGDENRNVTLRRLTKEEAAAERAARKKKRVELDAASDISGSAVNTRRGFRRQDTVGGNVVDSAAGSVLGSMPESVAGGSSAGASTVTPGGLGARMQSPAPSFARKGKRHKDSAYYSERPEIIGVGTQMGSPSNPSSHGTWSALSPGTTGTALAAGTNGISIPASPSSGAGDAAERRRRRRAERQRNDMTQSKADYT